MMKKAGMCLLMVPLLLSGCTQYENLSLQEELDTRLVLTEEKKASRPTFHKEYYSYYIEPSIGRMQGDDTCNVFNYEGNQFLMNINVAGIINDTYYKDHAGNSPVLDDAYCVAIHTGEYTDYDANKHTYTVSIYDFDKICFTEFTSDAFLFYGSSDALAALNLSSVMLQIAKSSVIHEKETIASFSNVENAVSNGEKFELFKSIAPESGRVTELFEDHYVEGITDSNDTNTKENVKISGDEASKE